MDAVPERLAFSPETVERQRATLAKWRATGRYPAFIRHEATHEAAHAVIAEAVGGEVVGLTLAADLVQPYCRARVSGVSSYYQRRRVVQAMAGQAAEVVGGWRRGDWHRVHRGDREHALAAARTMTYLDQGLDELLHHLWLATLRLVRMNWPAVRALATALLERETLDGDAVRAIIQGSRP